MIPPLLSRRVDGRPLAPARIVHLGLGSFFRSHPAWYTERAPDAAGWGFAAFTGRSRELPDRLAAQDHLYTLIARGAAGDDFEVVSTISASHAGADHDAWLSCFRRPDLAAVTLTVTEAGYRCPASAGRIPAGPTQLDADAAALRGDPTAPVGSVPARLVAGLVARSRAGLGPVAVVPCDNLPGNGDLVAAVVARFADMVAPGLAGRLDGAFSAVSTVVDRITPRATPDDERAVAAATGRLDRCPVTAEPFCEWVIAGDFPAGRPDWERAGAVFTDDVTAYENRKLWLLNGAHSLLAYAGSLLGHATVPEAISDPACHSWVQEWWSEAAPLVGPGAGSVGDYTAALVQRFSNTRMGDSLARIAEDGSQKLPVRVVPVLAEQRRRGGPVSGAVRIVAAWVCHLRGLGAPVRDVRAGELAVLAGGDLSAAVPRLIAVLDPALVDDPGVVAAVADECGRLTALGRRPPAGGPGSDRA